MAVKFKRLSDAERKIVTIDRLKELLNYDPVTGLFSRLSAPRPQAAHYIGKPVGCIKRGPRSAGGGYRMVSVDGRRYRAHHLVWFYVTGEWPTGDVDHEDTDRDNNRWRNLRPATRSQNIANARLAFDNWTGVKGITFDHSRGKWLAQIVVRGRRYHLGRFDDKDVAARAYREAAQRHFGEFARTE